MPAYLDTSAFIKLVRSEPESAALGAAIAESGEPLVSSTLLVVEGRRAAARYGELAHMRARSALTAITLLPLDDAVVERAAALGPPELRSLDALHLATALELGSDMVAFYCYGGRLATAAASHGVDVQSPA